MGNSSVVRAFVGLGSNQGDSLAIIGNALAMLGATPGIVAVRASHFYRSRAWGGVEQPDFINACACFDTRLEPLALLDVLQAIETIHGRQRVPGQQWGPRTLDLDLLLYGQQVIDLPRLQVPHPWMLERGFVLVPLADLDRKIVIPGRGSIAEALLSIDAGELIRIGG